MKHVLFSLLTLIVLAGCGHPTADGSGIVFKTADPNLSIGFRLLPAEVIPADEVGEAEPDPLPTPPCIVVKGNISRDGRKLYHIEGMPNFNQVKIDEAAGERFFCSEQEAIDAGWTKAGGR